jgi:hypothetical protein
MLHQISEHCPTQRIQNVLGEIEQCGRGARSRGPSSAPCECLYEAYNLTLEVLRTNETLWFQWLDQPGFGDAYQSNYYLKRMLDGDRRGNPEALQCLQNNTATTTLSSSSSFSSLSLNCTSPDCDLLLELTPSSRCSLPSGGLTEVLANNFTRARLEAEHLLRTQYDFMILEHLSDPSTPFFFSSLLREPNVDLIRKLLRLSHSPNSGLVSHIPARYQPPPAAAPPPASFSSEPDSAPAAQVFTSKYAYLFPESVMAFLLSENAEDIALYEFAVALYQHRIQRLMSQVTRPSSRHP